MENRKIHGEQQRSNTQGSLTVEASLVLPLFLCVVLFFVSFFQVMYIQEQVSLGLWETAKEISQYSYCYEMLTEDSAKENTDGNKTTQLGIGPWIYGGLTGQKMRSYLSAGFLNSSCVIGGEKGIVYTTRAFEKEKEIEITATYKLGLPLLNFVVPAIPMVQRVRTRAFVGTEAIGLGKEDEDDIYVYISETGTVYHVSEECSHISLKIFSVAFAEVEQLRNMSGGRYTSCERCVKSKKLSTDQGVYVTEDGDKYHRNLQCGGLKRTVSKVKLSMLSGYPPCIRCGQ